MGLGSNYKGINKSTGDMMAKLTPEMIYAVNAEGVKSK